MGSKLAGTIGSKFVASLPPKEAPIFAQEPQLSSIGAGFYDRDIGAPLYCRSPTRLADLLASGRATITGRLYGRRALPFGQADELNNARPISPCHRYFFSFNCHKVDINA